MMSKNDEEKRRFKRVNFEVEVTVKSGENQWRAELLDLCLKGALVKGEPAIRPALDSTGTLTVDLGAQARIVMAFTVVHADGDRFGLRCDSIDLDSITHLKRLVELNSGDPDDANRELASLLEAN